jgi:hypothetical protein
LWNAKGTPPPGATGPIDGSALPAIPELMPASPMGRPRQPEGKQGSIRPTAEAEVVFP